MKLNKVLMLVAAFSLVAPSFSIQASVADKAKALEAKIKQNKAKSAAIITASAVGIIVLGFAAAIAGRTLRNKFGKKEQDFGPAIQHAAGDTFSSLKIWKHFGKKNADKA